MKNLLKGGTTLQVQNSREWRRVNSLIVPSATADEILPSTASAAGGIGDEVQPSPPKRTRGVKPPVNSSAKDLTPLAELSPEYEFSEDEETGDEESLVVPKGYQVQPLVLKARPFRNVSANKDEPSDDEGSNFPPGVSKSRGGISVPLEDGQIITGPGFIHPTRRNDRLLGEALDSIKRVCLEKAQSPNTNSQTGIGKLPGGLSIREFEILKASINDELRIINFNRKFLGMYVKAIQEHSNSMRDSFNKQSPYTYSEIDPLPPSRD